MRPTWLPGRLLALAAAATVLLLANLYFAGRAASPAGSAASLDGYLGIPDCPPGAEDDVLAPLSLQCWFYGTTGAWRLVSIASAYQALVIEAEVTDFEAVDEMASGIVGGVGSDIGEVLVYAARLRRLEDEPLVPATENLVVRVRWTVTDGFSMLEFAGGASSGR